MAGLFPERAGLSMQDIPWAKPSFRQELKPRPSEKSGFWPQSSLQQQASESWDGFLLDVRGIVLVPDGPVLTAVNYIINFMFPATDGCKFAHV